MKRALAALSLCVIATLPAWAGEKENQHALMLDLGQQMLQLKASGQGASASYSALRAQYDQLSAAMGGDDPARTLANGQPAVDGRSASAPEGGTIGVIPAPPSGCVVSTFNATQATPLAIPTGPAVVSGTVAVAGAGTFVWDINLRTNLTHTFAADLDVTLTSPAGTVVTLTTDNGAGNDNVFNGTAWDDDANPAGQVPYTTNNGLVTDQAYVNLTLASPLVPEEAMGAFFGENPNGTWTVTISDDLAGDGGSLDSWEIEVSTLATPPIVLNTAATQSTPTAIPTGPAVVTSTLVVAGAGTALVDVDLTTNITHTFNADLDITLMSPAGTIVTISTDNGAGNDNVFNGTVWNDDANPAGQVPYTTNNGVVSDQAYVNLTTATPLVPEEAMAAFIGEDPNGTWTITISDDLTGDGGSLDSWSLDIDTATCGCTLTCPANLTAPNDPAQCGAVMTYPAPTGSCTNVTCVAPSGSFFPVGVTQVTCNDPLAIAACNFSITINDLEPPLLLCPADISQTLPPGDPNGPVNFPDPTVSDNCPGVGLPTCVPPSGSIFPGAATTPVNCSALDASQNTGACAFNVTLDTVSIVEVPTLSQWGLAGLALLLAGAAFLVLRRQG